ncbi:restriction endonuclease subunit S [Tsukamurella tyrosinosolvens]|uniref:restriction endonuclease subunit S n=1 Tax=Tsukamurella tyrosinosolvens TaxID=57704 RepID=UPI0036779334
MTRLMAPTDDEWCREVPEEWDYLPLRRVGVLVGGSTPPASDENWDGSIPFVTPPDLRPVTGGSIGSTLRSLTAAGASTGSSIVSEGSVLLSIRAPIGYVARTEMATAFNQGCRAIVPSASMNARYLTYALVAGEQELDAQGRGTTFMELSSAQMATIRIPVPPLIEQRAIADFLDRETARIDTLLEEQQRLIELLSERRTSTVFWATTRGLDSSVVLADNGLEWCNETPEVWGVKALRRYGTFVTGSTPSTDNVGNFEDSPNGKPWVRPQDLSPDTVASAWLSDQGWGDLRAVPAGSVLVGCIAYSLGSVGYLNVAATTNQQITSIIPDEHGRYLYYLMAAARDELWASSQMNRVPILNNQRLGAIHVPAPPVDEQRRIAAYLDEQTAKIDALIAESERFIELSRERRSALITAAVTGQIDVRDEVAS